MESRRLPNEMVDYILGFASTRDLLYWRTVSRGWNELVSQRLRRYSQHQVNFRVNRELGGFVQLLKTRIPEATFPFSTFKIVFRSGFTMQRIQKFSEAVGPHVLTYNIHAKFKNTPPGYPPSSELLPILLQGATNLENLRVKGLGAGGFPKLTQVFPKLKILTVIPTAHHGYLGVKAIRDFIANAPALVELDCRHKVWDFECIPSFIQLLTGQNYTSLHLRLLLKPVSDNYLRELARNGNRMRIRKLQLQATNLLTDWTLVNEWLESISRNLTELTLYGHFTIPACEFPKLEVLHLDCHQKGNAPGLAIQGGTFEPSKLPALKTVKLNANELMRTVPLRSVRLFPDEPFPTVERLEVRGNLDTEFFGAPGKLHTTFPNLTSLHLLMCNHPTGVTRYQLTLIVTHYPNLLHLTLWDFQRRGDFYPMLSGELNSGGRDLSFARFQRLKSLEIGGENKKGVLRALVKLTQLHLVPQIDYVGVYAKNDDKWRYDLSMPNVNARVAVVAPAEPEPCEEVNLLRELRWHKEISIDSSRGQHGGRHLGIPISFI